jgi:hypothetical protein
VPRDGGLGQLQDFHEITDAELARLKQAQNPEPDGIRKRPEHEIDLRFGRRGHIRVSELNPTCLNQVNDNRVNNAIDTRRDSIAYGWPGSMVEQLKLIDPLTNPSACGDGGSRCLPRGELRRFIGGGCSGRPALQSKPAQNS